MATAKPQTAQMRRWIGRRIRRRRLFMQMTQGALAHALGVTFQQVQKYEKGANRVPAERLMQICRQLEVTPDYFTQGTAGAEAAAAGHFVQSAQGLALYRGMA